MSSCAPLIKPTYKSDRSSRTIASQYAVQSPNCTHLFTRPTKSSVRRSCLVASRLHYSRKGAIPILPRPPTPPHARAAYRTCTAHRSSWESNHLLAIQVSQLGKLIPLIFVLMHMLIPSSDGIRFHYINIVIHSRELNFVTSHRIAHLGRSHLDFTAGTYCGGFSNPRSLNLGICLDRPLPPPVLKHSFSVQPVIWPESHGKPRWTATRWGNAAFTPASADS